MVSVIVMVYWLDISIGFAAGLWAGVVTMCVLFSEFPTKQERRIMAKLDELRAQVAANTEVVGSAITLIRGLADKLEEAKTDPQAIDEIISELRSTDESLGQAVAESTPSE